MYMAYMMLLVVNRMVFMRLGVKFYIYWMTVSVVFYLTVSFGYNYWLVIVENMWWCMLLFMLRCINRHNMLFTMSYVYMYLVGWWGVRLSIGLWAREWLYTTNHKRLGLLYIWFAGINAIFGTTLATLISVELAQTGSCLFMNNTGSYHIVVAIHAILMVFFVVTPIVFGGFGNYFLPTQVGARDVAYPRLNNFSVWVLPAGLITMFSALWDSVIIKLGKQVVSSQFSAGDINDLIPFMKLMFDTNKEVSELALLAQDYSHGVQNSVYIIENDTRWESVDLLSHSSGAAFNGESSDTLCTMAGWTFTTPFSQNRFTGRAVDLALMGLVFATITSMFTTINLIASWRFLRGRGAKHQKELFPIFLISAFISLRLLLLVSPILTTGFIMLLADSQFFTAFFTMRAGGDVLLFQHIFWFFGHPEVYILVMPGFGVASTVIPYYTRKPMSSKMHMVYAMHAIGSMSLVVWGHHMYLVGIDTKARTLFMTITIMMGLPSTMKMCGWIVSASNGLTFMSLDLWLVIMFVSIFFVGGMSGLMVAGAGLDILLHDTYYVVGHFHVMLSGAMILSVLGWIYFNFRELFGSSYSWIFAGIHLFCHVIGHLLCFMPMLWLGYSGMPRRIHDYPTSYNGWHGLASVGHMIVLVGLLSYSWLLFSTIYFKSPLLARHLGLPFISTRCAFLILDKHYAFKSSMNLQISGLSVIRTYKYMCAS